MPEVTNSYETVFILSTKLGEDGIASLVQKFKDLIAANGTVDGVDEWGKRRLAYLINKEAEGYYVLIDFTSVACLHRRTGPYLQDHRRCSSFS